jgi:hypothetical protein
VGAGSHCSVSDPADEAPWAMQPVARVEKTDPPTRSAVCQAAAVAVVQLLADERAQPDGEWFAEVHRSHPAGDRELQLSGSELDICTDPVLPLRKAAAAAGHAAQIAAMRMPADRLVTWAAAGYPVTVEHPAVARWTRLRPDAQVEIVDAGFTAVAPGSCTALARWA